MFKEVMKINLTENEMWFEICKVLFHQKISCASVIAKKINYDPTKVAGQLNRLEEVGIIESTGKITINYLAEHKKGTFGKFYLLTETAREVLKEILEE